METATSPAPDVEHPTDTALLTDVLRCYKPHCRYLRSMTVRVTEGRLTGRGELRIPESCYIDDTGHLNAVEVNICYNQMLYYVIAAAVEWNLTPAFARWTMDDYWAKQLPDILIARMQSSFLRPIDPRSFHGEFEVLRSTRLKDMLTLETAFRYGDDAGGRCDGRVRVAITNA
ncbi:FcoT-like thioesterase domain protein [Actinomadura rubteroloni]|uniref:(2E)-enoyl-[ACP] glycyltransferase n=1 Tax=Actinomadura rubteroloni TaxID=1926885 RepID=A0A2P4UDN1_9ACTN|nr:FcoT family thioesterase [Actinomadura rubteroloni]POM23160.1 FcoT-like thioesterase domain protein [Actinomadura rubteroloni]